MILCCLVGVINDDEDEMSIGVPIIGACDSSPRPPSSPPPPPSSSSSSQTLLASLTLQDFSRPWYRCQIIAVHAETKRRYQPLPTLQEPRNRINSRTQTRACCGVSVPDRWNIHAVSRSAPDARNGPTSVLFVANFTDGY